MKKLYAKTSFAQKKSNGKQAKTATGAESDPDEIQRYPSPIMAYRQNGNSAGSVGVNFDTATINKTPKMTRAASAKLHDEIESRRSISPPMSLDSNQSYYRASGNEAAHHYYSIGDLEHVQQMNWQQQQRMRQQEWRRRRLTNTPVLTAPLRPFHQHTKMVLQLPKANNGGDVTPTKTTSPIYELPTTNGFASLPPDLNHRDMNGSNVVCVASAKGEEAAVGSINSLWQGNANNKHDKCLSTTTTKSMLQHSQSMPMSRTKPTSNHQQTANFYQHSNDAEQQQQQQQIELQNTHNNNSYRKSELQNQTLPIQRHNSVKENYISRPTNGVAVIQTEQSIIGARASVMVYDDVQKKWLPSGSSSGLSKVQIFQHQQNNTFRVVGRKLQDHEVVINCSIMKGLKYNQATATFHQWRDSKYVYGLNFSSHNDADAFARAMTHALDVLSGRAVNNPAQPTNGNGYEEDMGYRTMTSEDAAILRQQQITGQVTPSAQTPTSQTNQNNIPQSPPTPQGHHRTSRNSLSAPPTTQTTGGMALAQTQQTAQQQLFGPNGATQNGLQPQQVQLPVGQQAQTAQNQYHAPQQLQPQTLGVYTTQQVLNAAYQQGNQFQPQQTHYVISNSNPNLNIHQYSQQQHQQQQQQQQQQNPQQPLPSMPPPHQNGGPIYVSTAQTQAVHGMTSSASSNSVVYASQQQLSAGAAAVQAGPMPNGGGPPPPPPHAYGQLNGVMQESPYGQVPKPPPTMSLNTNGVVPMPPPLNRMNSLTAGGPVPPPPPSFGYNNNAPPPPAPPAPPSAGGGAAPPPPPPPPMGGGVNTQAKDPQADLMSSLAAQLQQAKLKKKTSIASADTNGSNNSSGGNYGTIGRTTTGMASMMDEMAKTLARRRAQAEKKEPEPDNEMKQRPWEKSNTLPHKLGSSSNSSTNTSNTNSNNTSNSGGESPRPIRKRFGSASEETILKVNGDGLSLALSGGDLDALKAEIVREMRQELNKFKQDIIDAIKSEFNRR